MTALVLFVSPLSVEQVIVIATITRPLRIWLNIQFDFDVRRGGALAQSVITLRAFVIMTINITTLASGDETATERSSRKVWFITACSVLQSNSKLTTESCQFDSSPIPTCDPGPS